MCLLMWNATYVTLNMETAQYSLMGNVIRIEVSFLDHILYEYYETHSYTCIINHNLKNINPPIGHWFSELWPPTLDPL